MRRKTLLLCSLILLCLSTPAHAQLWSGIIDPSRAVDWSQAGVTGGIPNRTTICATLSPGAGTTQINAAIAACPAGQVVFLSAGRYTITGGINFSGKSNVTLRGAGPDQTTLAFIGADGCLGRTADICIQGSSNIYNGNVPAGNIHNWTAGYAKGTTVITLDSVSGITVGMILVLDQLDDTSDTGWIFVKQAAPYQTGGGESIGRGGNRAQEQLVKVTAINGTNVTITPGLYMPNWRSSQAPQAWFWGTVAQTAAGDGVENMTLDHSGSTGSAGIEFDTAYNGWVKNVRSLNSNRDHVWAIMAAHVTVQDSYFYGTQGQSSLSYGVESFPGGDMLVQNNIFQHVTTPILFGEAVGNVVAYNYGIDMFNNSTYMYEAFYASHHGAAGMNLFEGNITNGFGVEMSHGTSNLITVFRNGFSGKDLGDTQNTIPVLNQSYQRYSNIIGNVLGTSGYHLNYEDSAGAAGVTGDIDHSIYSIGYTSGGEGYATGLPYDAYTYSTMYRWGNFDYATNTVRWLSAEVPSGQFVPSTHILPNSLFLSSKPSWWGTMPWPAIGPDVTGGQDPSGHVYDIPAIACYKVSAKDITGILTFNANTCYGNTFPVPLAPPKNLKVQ
jgi:hypothetical protein